MIEHSLSKNSMTPHQLASNTALGPDHNQTFLGKPVSSLLQYMVASRAPGCVSKDTTFIPGIFPIFTVVALLVVDELAPLLG